MTETEYKEALRGLAYQKDEDMENRIRFYEEEKKQYKQRKKNLKAELREQKKDYKKQKREVKEDYKEKKEYLKNVFKDIPPEQRKTPKIKEKTLSDEEIYALRRKKKLPMYTHGEEVFNMVTHIVGGGLGIVGLILSIIACVLYKPGDALCMASMIVFGITNIILYTNSAVYHGLHINTGKAVFQVIDHCTIYILIAGTYTPVVLLGLGNIAPWHYVLLGSVYALAILGVVLNATMMRKKAVKIISMILYIAIGWCIIFFYPFLLPTLGIGGTWLLIAGGITYTVGSILYGIGAKKKYWHSIFHLFVIGGTVLQYLSVVIYAIMK